MSRAYCNICKKTVKYKLAFANFTTMVNGKEYNYLGQEAHCVNCNSLLNIDEINNYNMKSFANACQKKNENSHQNQLKMSYPDEIQILNAYAQYARLLAKCRVTSYRVAKETGVEESTLSKWKLGKSVPNFETLWKIANYFQVPIDYFTKGESAPDEDEIAFERLKKGLKKYNFNETDVDFLINVFKAHKKSNDT